MQHPPKVVAFVDGQNLFHAAREAFGHKFPNYDAPALAEAVCAAKGWDLSQTRFYTGVPDSSDNPFWHHFWTSKVAQMRRRDPHVHIYSRPLRYRNRPVTLSDGTVRTMLVGEEKGIDVRIAVDVIRLAHQGAYDVALLFSQDQDLSEVADEVRVISIEQSRWIKVACAYPTSPTSKNRRGINKTDWIKIYRETYDAAIDPRDYRPKP